MGNLLSCARNTTDTDTYDYSKQKYHRNGLYPGGYPEGTLSSVAPDLLPLEAAQFAREKRLSRRSSGPSTPTNPPSVNNNDERKQEFTFEAAFALSNLKSIPRHDGQLQSVTEEPKDNEYREYHNVPNKWFKMPLPPVPDHTPSKQANVAEPIPEEVPTPPTERKQLPPENNNVTPECASPRLPPRPSHLKMPTYPIANSPSDESLVQSPPPRKTVEFREEPSRQVVSDTSVTDSPGASPLSQSVSPSSVKRRPKKPPRNYSYKASTLPKRISHTTEEVMELWDEVRKALSLEKVHETQGRESNDEDDDDIDEIYQNLYAARMRSWQIVCLAQDVIVERLKPETVWRCFLEDDLISSEQLTALKVDRCTTREANQLIIDLILEKGDGYFDRLRELLRSCDDQKQLSDLLETLNEVFIIGAKANKWTFSLTTKHCTVSYSKASRNSDQPDIIGDTEEACRPTVTLEVFDENFGNGSCLALSSTLNKYNVISHLNLGKNRITAKGLAKLLVNFEDNKSLVKLNLRLNPIENIGLDVLEDALRMNHCLKELILCYTNLQAGCGKTIGQILSLNHTLQMLDLSYNEISDRDCKDIHTGLQQNTTLQQLNLRGNQITAQGCEHLCDALSTNSSLVCLDLSHNQLDNQGAKSIALLIAASSSLRELYLEKTEITEDGLRHLTDALHSNISIQTLHLSSNSIGDVGAANMAELLKTNQSIQVLYMNLCNISRIGLLQILKVLSTDNQTLKMLGVCYNNLLLFDDAVVQDGCQAADVRQELTTATEHITDRKILTWGKAFT